MKIKKLPHGVSIRKDFSGNRIYWVLRLGSSWTGGNAKRYTFPTATEAVDAWEKEKNKHEELGKTAHTLTVAEIAEAKAAFAAAEEMGTTLTAIVSHYHRTAARKKSISYDDAMLLAQKKVKDEGLRQASIVSLNARWRHFRAWLLSTRPAKIKTLSAVTQDDAREYVESRDVSQSTRLHMRDEMSTLFRYAKEAGYIDSNPMRGIVIRRNKIKHRVTILTPKQVTDLLRAAKEGCEGTDRANHPVSVVAWESVPLLVLGLFAGLRPQEALRLDWSEIGEKHIDLAGEKTKKGVRRLVPVESSLRTWLDAYPLPKDGQVAPKNWRRKFAVVAKNAGLQPWPQDCLRHSYGSYHYAQGRNMPDTMTFMGHHDRSTFLTHYYEVVTPEAAKSYWSIVP